MIKLFESSFSKKDEIVWPHGNEGRIKIILRTIKYMGFDGGWHTYSFPWVVLDRGNAVAILLHDPVHEEIILIEQFRPAVLRNVIEIPAGMIEGGEDQVSRVVKEIFEETGITTTSNITPITTFLVSPGISNEKIFLYYALVTNLGENENTFGLTSEGENILKHVIGTKEAFNMLDMGMFEDAKTIIALQWLRNELK